jgi:DNA-binding MarR family transcriptional regulator
MLLPFTQDRDAFTARQVAVLALVASSDDTIWTNKTLAATIGCSSPSVAAICAKLADRGLIQQSCVNGDRRLTAIRATQRGSALLGAGSAS